MPGVPVLTREASSCTQPGAPASRPAPPTRQPGTAARQPGTATRRTFWAWAGPLGGLAVLAFLLWQLGTGPFLDGLRLIDRWAVAAALGLGALTTVCCAWRWSLVAGGLGLRLPLGTAVAACYRSVFLNATLPGGVLGDAHRAVHHGRDVGDVGRGIRAVVWERAAGQFVQLGIAMIVLLAFPSPVRPYLLTGAVFIAAAGAGVLGAVRLSQALPRSGRSQRARTQWAQARWAQAFRAAKADIRDGLLARGNWLGIVLASAGAVSGHLAMFLVAARTAGSTAPLSRLLPLTLLALLAMGLPANLGGFGPREGVAAWAFGAAGLTATQGVATAVVYGGLVLVSSLPGAAVLLVRLLGRIRVPVTPVVPVTAVTASPAGAAGG